MFISSAMPLWLSFVVSYLISSSTIFYMLPFQHLRVLIPLLNKPLGAGSCFELFSLYNSPSPTTLVCLQTAVMDQHFYACNEPSSDSQKVMLERMLSVSKVPLNSYLILWLVCLLENSLFYLTISSALWVSTPPSALACFCCVWQATAVLQVWHQFKGVCLIKTSCPP